MFWVYVLDSPSCDKIYVGFTSDLEGRLVAHNHESNKGWTRSFKPWQLIYHEKFQTKAKAMVREKQLKNANCRRFIR